MRYARNAHWPVLPCHGIKPVGGALGCTCLGKNPRCHPGKHPFGPLVPHGLKDATLSPHLIEEWFYRYPFLNVGIRTGTESGLLVLDMDPDHGGEESLVYLERRIPFNFSATLTAETGSGGFHYYFLYDKPDISVSAGLIGDGLDIRGQNGLVIAPGSLHISGHLYRWLNLVKPLPAPEGLIQLLREVQPKRGARQVPAYIEDGKRRVALLAFGGAMRAWGCDAEEIYAALWEINERRCKTPCPEDHIWAIAVDCAKLDIREHTRPPEVLARIARNLI